MSRRSLSEPAETDLSRLLASLIASGPDAPDLAEKLSLAGTIRSLAPETSQHLDRFLLEEIGRLRPGLEAAQGSLKKLQAMVDKLTAPPWFTATFLRNVSTGSASMALVSRDGARRLVAWGHGLDPAGFEVGDEVYLNQELNALLAKSAEGGATAGDTALFERALADGRLVLRWHGDPIVVETGNGLRKEPLKKDDEVRFDRTTLVAVERVEKATGKHWLMEEVPSRGVQRLGGQRENLERLLAALTTTLLDPERARRYGLGDGRASILLQGPPGCGKTLMARICASEVGRMSGKRVRFGVVRPAAWESMWVGETQRNIREFFQALRESAQDGLAVGFLDEVETIGRQRGSAGGIHADRSLGALLAEIDGFEGRGNVALIAATNRADMLDPALYERLSGIVIEVKRPDLRATREIAEVHLPPEIPFHSNGCPGAETRSGMIDLLVSRLHAPNADGEIAVLRFRDGRARTVLVRELVSGRLIEGICKEAKRVGFLRDVRGGEPGLIREDLEHAVSEAIGRLRTAVTRYNVHSYLSDLPQDVDVVAVEPVVRKVKRAHRYLDLGGL